MNIDLKNLIRRLSFFVPATRHQNCFDKSQMNIDSIFVTQIQFSTIQRSLSNPSLFERGIRVKNLNIFNFLEINFYVILRYAEQVFEIISRYIKFFCLKLSINNFLPYQFPTNGTCFFPSKICLKGCAVSTVLRPNYPFKSCYYSPMNVASVCCQCANN